MPWISNKRWVAINTRIDRLERLENSNTGKIAFTRFSVPSPYDESTRNVLDLLMKHLNVELSTQPHLVIKKKSKIR